MSYVTPARLGKFKELQDTAIANTYLPLAGGTITGDIVPDEDNKVSLGTSSKKLKEIYAHELKLSTNSLYLGDTKILGTESNTINIKADAGQSLALKSQGTGTTNINSFTGINIETVAENGANPNLSSIRIKALGEGSAINMNAPTINMTGATTISNLTVSGNFNVTGTTTSVNSTNLDVKDNVITINKGETGEGVTAKKAGIMVDRGEADNYWILFDETDDLFKVGTNSNMGILATRGYVTGITDNKADKATTLAGYGITDAKILNGVITLGSNTITPIVESDITAIRNNAKAGADYATAHAADDTGAQINKIETVKVNGTALTITDKAVNIDISGKSDNGHTHDDRYYTESEMDTLLGGKANTTHGNHVPAPETANNAKFLRNDNTWALVTPANIGALSASYTSLDATKLNGTIPASCYTNTIYTHPAYTAQTSGLYKFSVDGTGHVNSVTGVSKEDIVGLGIPAQDTVYTHPTYTSKTNGLYKITVDGTGHVSATTAVAKADITGLGIPAQDTVYTHPTGDGNKHVPATGTTNNGKFLMAGSTAGSLSWGTPADHITTVTTTGSGNAVTAITADANGAITVTKGATYNNYSHPTGDGNLHVPANGTANNGKFLMAGATAGTLSWGIPTDTVTTATTTGSGNAVTSITASNGALTITKGTTFLTSHQDISGKADKASVTAGTAGTSSATSGASLAVPYVTVNAQGIVTGYGTHTHTISGFLTSHQDISGKANLSGATFTGNVSIGGTVVNATNGHIVLASGLELY